MPIKATCLHTFFTIVKQKNPVKYLFLSRGFFSRKDCNHQVTYITDCQYNQDNAVEDKILLWMKEDILRNVTRILAELEISSPPPIRTAKLIS